MLQRPFEGGWIIRLETGEPIIESITSFCEQNGVEAGSFTGIGAVRSLRIGYYNQETDAYEEMPITGGYEVLSLTGNISRKSDGTLFPHTHIVVSDRQYRAIGGHLFEAEVGPTLEIYLHTSGVPVVRRAVAGSHLELLDL